MRHKALRRFAATGDPRGLPAASIAKLARILHVLADAREPEDARLPGFRLHSLAGGRLAGMWSIRVTANWRIVFRFESGEAVDIDLVDYH
ncbi:MAG: type II toxin-antitoxin system RelE/ParE family toxin [Gammaproteobacteria bacterium]|nr:type II toxin-antitoxin system RelE/ParE family toxin [Gammaproteobacteria bacterium]